MFVYCHTTVLIYCKIEGNVEWSGQFTITNLTVNFRERLTLSGSGSITNSQVTTRQTISQPQHQIICGDGVVVDVEATFEARGTSSHFFGDGSSSECLVRAANFTLDQTRTAESVLNATVHHGLEGNLDVFTIISESMGIFTASTDTFVLDPGASINITGITLREVC